MTPSTWAKGTLMANLSGLMRTADLTAWAQRRGYRAAWGPWGVVEEALVDLASRRRAGELDGALDREYLIPLEDPPRAPGESPGWVILVLVPRPAHRVTFIAGGKPYRTLLPPTYARYRAVRAEVIEDLQAAVFDGCAPLAPLQSAHKSVAARLGLVAYGRNNVTYAEGLGSYFQIAGCSTSEDLSEGAARPRPPARLETCTSCNACVAACPTSAIQEDRFLLRAERCVVYFNERTEEFPSWVPPGAHQCLMGCLLCQTRCPVNAGKLRVEDTDVVFTEEETRSVLNPSFLGGEAFRRRAEEKLSSLGLTEEPAPLWRNLRLLFAARGWFPSAG